MSISRTVEHDELGVVELPAEYWVMIYRTGTQRKGLHLPAPESTFDDPVKRCDHPIPSDGVVVAKSLAKIPPGYDPSRICTDCLKTLGGTA